MWPQGPIHGEWDLDMSCSEKRKALWDFKTEARDRVVVAVVVDNGVRFNSGEIKKTANSMGHNCKMNRRHLHLNAIPVSYRKF